jgi:hypothetical protein
MAVWTSCNCGAPLKSSSKEKDDAGKSQSGLIYTYHAGTGNSKFHNQEGEDAVGLDGSRPCKHLTANLSACCK